MLVAKLHLPQSARLEFRNQASDLLSAAPFPNLNLCDVGHADSSSKSSHHDQMVWSDAYNPAAAARLSVEKKYLASNPELNTIAISHLRYIPSVAGAEDALKSAAKEMKAAGLLDPTTDVAGLAKKAFVHLDGGSDEWLRSLQVDKIAGGQVPADEDFRLKAELAANVGISNLASCCSPGEK